MNGAGLGIFGWGHRGLGANCIR